MTSTDLRVLVLAGGASSRFFPVNKIFADPTGAGRNMIQQAYDRAAGVDVSGGRDPLIGPERFFVVAGPDAEAQIKDCLPVANNNVLIEPARRNTLPAILWALAHIRIDDPKAVLAILTADHLIGDIAAFRSTVAQAADVARARQAIITIGIKPSAEAREWVSFGTIKAVDDDAGSGHSLVDRFEEKPSEARAQAMIEDGDWSWNAGMFVFRVDVLEDALARLQPATFAAYEPMCRALQAGRMDEARACFERLPSKIAHPSDALSAVDNSIDYAIMMPLTAKPTDEFSARVIPARFPWSDIGTWDALAHVVARDPSDNVLIGDVSVVDASRCIVVAEPGMRVRVEGRDDLVVVQAKNASALICPVRSAPNIKGLVQRIGANPAQRVFFENCTQCLVDTGGLRVGLLDVTGVAVSFADGVLTVSGAPDDVHTPLSERALALVPQISQYAWGANVLPTALGIAPPEPDLPSAEAWLTSTERNAQVVLQGAPMSLSTLVQTRPSVLGSWVRAAFGDELPIFVKFLSTRFPDRVHMGFAPDALSEAMRTERDFSATFTGWLEDEQRLLGSFKNMLAAEKVASKAGFAAYARAYERWANRQALSNWHEQSADTDLCSELRDLLTSSNEVAGLTDVVTKLRQNRANVVRVLNDVDLVAEQDNLLLSRAGLAHAIFGLSHQTHPRDPCRETLSNLYRDGHLAVPPEASAALKEARPDAAAAPKNEAWLPFKIGNDMVIMEPQQTSNVTYSWLDMYTPFVLRDDRFAFRKGDAECGVDKAALARFVTSLDFTPDSVESLRYRPQELAVDPAFATDIRLFRLIDDGVTWPYFSLYRIDFEAGSRCTMRARDTAFSELVVCEGSVVLECEARCKLDATRGCPMFVPATMLHDYRLIAEESARVYVISVPTPDGACPLPSKRA